MMAKKFGCGSPDGEMEFVFCDDCTLSDSDIVCKEFRDSIPNLKIRMMDDDGKDCLIVICRACGKIAKIVYDDPGIDDMGMAVCKNRKCINYNDFANIGNGEYFRERYEMIV